MIRTAIKLAIVALVVHAGVKIVPVYWSYFKFKDAVQETANFSARRTTEEVRARVLAIAQRIDVPVTGPDIRVRKEDERTLVETEYTADLEYFPGRSYPMEFKIRVEGEASKFSRDIP
jgi:hypothetical protein